MHNGALKKWALALTFWVALHLSSLRAQVFTAPLQASTTGTNPVDLEFRADGTEISKGNYGVGSLLSTDEGAGTRMLWYPALGAFRAGGTTASEWNAANLGAYSAAMGYGTTASGKGSTAFGVGTTASGEYAAAWGYSTSSQAMLSFAIGQFNIGGGTTNSWIATDPLFEIGNGSSSAPSDALVVYKNGNATINGVDNEMPNQTLVNANSVLTQGLADGRYASSSGIVVGSGNLWGFLTAPNMSLLLGNATGPYAFAEGRGSSASGYYSLALGTSASASGNYSVATSGGSASGQWATALGRRTQASGGSSTALGTSTTASGRYATAMGSSTTASGNYSIAMGLLSTASGENATAMGYDDTASGNYATAIGRITYATGDGSVTLGSFLASASGTYAVAIGADCYASGYASTTLGYFTYAQGSYSLASGFSTTASGNYSTAMSLHTQAPAYAEVSLGQYNVGTVSSGGATSWVATDPLLEIGNGTSGNPSDALLLDKSGNATFQGNVTASGIVTTGNVTATAITATGAITTTGVITAAPSGDIPMYTGN